MRVATSNTEPLRGRSLLPAAEIALAGVTLASVAAMWRIFVDGSFFGSLALQTIAAHATVAFLRRRGVSIAGSAAATLAAAVLAITWAFLWDTTWLGIPTAETFREAGELLELAWRTFGHVRAPAPVLTGFLISTAAAVWVGAWLADLAAFRQWTPFEALIPAGTLFVFTSLFAADRARVLAAVLWMSVAMVFVLLHRAARQQTSPSWLGSDVRLGTQATVRVGVGLVVAAMFVAWLFGPRLPGAQADALVPFAPQDREGSRQTISPLVEMRGRLVEQSQTELLSVTSSRKAYWRMTSLDIFDGDVWASRGSFGDADGELAGSGNRGVPSEPVTQSYDILALETIWLPTAFEATQLEIADAGEIRWDDVSSTLIVSSALDSSDGLDYQVVSDIPTFRPADLQAAVDDVPSDIRDRNTELPDGFSARVTELARQVVEGAGTPYDQARALQDFFQEEGAFRYSLSAPPGHSSSAIEDFLFVTRTGYCEQFAGAYAAMARAIDLPARVAVGFTPGQRDPLEPNRFIVRGENAHAWPEVYLAGAGWVAFEPTPGRGAPGARGYTGLDESQDTAGPSTEPTTVPDPEAQPTEPTQPTESGPTPTEPPLEDVGALPEGIGPLDPGPDDTGRKVVTVLLVLAGLLVAAVVVGLGVAVARRIRRWTRRRRASTPDALVSACRQEVADAMAVLGVVQRRDESDAAFARRVSNDLGDPRPRRLGHLLTRASFDPVALTDDEAADAPALADAVRDLVRARTSAWQRARAAMDPRSPEKQALSRAPATGPRPTGPRISIRTASSSG